MDDAPIEGSFSVVKTEQPGPTVRYQATIKAQTDHKLSQVENVVFETAEKLNSGVAWKLMIPYLIKRVNLAHVKEIFAFMLEGKKPKPIRYNANKYGFEFPSPDGKFIESFTVQFIEL